MSRGRYSQSNEWDSRDDSSVYEPQNFDDDCSGDLNLDHCRLYIKNVPKGLNEAGLRAAFAKFGMLSEAYLSPDPGKSFALIKYETPGEAKLAMMKMNNTEPLKLQIQIAKKSKSQGVRRNKYYQDKGTNDVMERSDRSHGVSNRDREESGSVSSRGRHSRVQESSPNCDNNMEDLLMDDDYGFSDILDPNLHLELENLKLEQLKVREEQLQCKQRVILLKQAERKPMSQMTNRCILPDGKIVVRNVNERLTSANGKGVVRFSRDSRDADVSFSAGAGDSAQLKLPGLQRVAARQCVVCGNASDAYCSGCGITPYCSERCQRRDWQDRHSAVCHNLARMNNENAKAGVPLQPTRDSADNVPRSQPATPLRRPHGNTPNNNREQKKENSAETGNSSGGFTSKASVKSILSNGKEGRFRHPVLNRNFNKEKDYEPAQATKPVTPKKEEPETGNYRLPNALDKAKKPELPAAAPAKQNLVPKTSIPDPPTVSPEAVKPQEAAPPPKESTPAVKPASVSDVTPIKKMCPKNYLLEKMSVGESVIISVDAKAADCRITRGDFVCLTMSGAFEEDYHKLCEDFVLDCNNMERPAKLTPGETISYFNPEDCGWYRARCLNPTTLALLDSGKIVSVTAADKCRELPTEYEAIPEFCAVLACKTVEIGASLNCKILSQTPKGIKISMSDIETDADLGEAEVFRWLPTVDYPAAPVGIPEVARPPLTDGSKVLLVLADTLDKVFVRPADNESQRQYNDVLQQVLLSAMKAKPLTEPPAAGQTVIGKFVDDCYYRALVRRVNVKQNKYQIEYAEYGNVEVSTLENLYPCPPDFDLSNVKTQVSVLKLATPTDLSTSAKDYIKELMQDEELVLTIPDGRKSVPSGSEAALNVARNKVSVGARLVELCTPNWKKIEQNGGDVVGTEHIMFQSITYTTLPKEGCTVEVLDIGVFRGGAICGYDRTDTNADMVFNQLTVKMADYCNSELGREPYLPKPEELCIAQLPPYPQWFRAVFLDLVSGPGSSEAKLCFLDYGNIANVPVTLLRKMMPEFITGIPVMGLYIEIRGFPQEIPDETLLLGVQHMNIDDEGRGTLKVSNCELQTDGIYLVDAPDLMKVLKGLTPGETISYFNPEDCGWYRARCLNPTTLALLDSGKIVSVTAADKCRELPTEYEAIPEFCAVLACKTVEIGASLNCKILSQTPKGIKISMSDVETDAELGEAKVFRWLSTVDYPTAPVGIPEVARPPLTDGSKVLLVLADTLDKVFVRPADNESQRQYNDVLQQVLLSAMKAKPLTEPPAAGQTVIVKFVDDCYCRALVRRVNVKQNKYQIEYAEFGNVEVSTLENLYPCPPDFDLSNVKTQVSVLKLATPTDLSTAAKDYIKELMQDEELVLTIPDGRKSVPSGSEAALNVARNKVSVGARLVELCTPNWKKIEQNGGDVLGTEHIMFQSITYTTLPKEGCTVEVLDIGVFRGGAICGYDRTDTNADMVFNQLTVKMADYCNSELGREPYLPRPEELCIAQLPPYPQWFRAVFLDLVSGPGSSEAKLCFLDYGNIDNVPVTLLRKMMPEFITGIPVMGLYIEIRGFPQEIPDETLLLGVQHMNIDDEGRGTLKVSNCELQTDGIYLVDAPDLMKVLKGFPKEPNAREQWINVTGRGNWMPTKTSTKFVRS